MIATAEIGIGAGVTSQVRSSRLRVPRHIGIIPDGNRRWAVQRGLQAAEWYAAGVPPGLRLLKACREMGVREATVYGFTQENVRRPKEQVAAFQRACVAFVEEATNLGVAIRVFGDASKRVFPKELARYLGPRSRNGEMRVNLLVNYGWNWDLATAWKAARAGNGERDFRESLATADISRIELIVRWGGRRRLSGFPPVQSAYADLCGREPLARL